jgi:tetratricopeptide (TPR) repeat protein
MMLQKKRWTFFRSAFTAITLLSAWHVKAQVLTPDLPGNRSFVLTTELYVQAHYAVAALSARQYLDQLPDQAFTTNSNDSDKAHYLLALVAIKKGAPGCADTALKAIGNTGNQAYKERIMFALAQYYFLHGDLALAIPLYEKTGIDNLNNSEIADEKFELAYCYFSNRQFDKAAPLFASIKELKDGKYYLAGNYYYGLLAYNENKYKEALQSFDRIKDLKEYNGIVPYYIAEIYYFMGNREKALVQAEALLKRPEPSYYDNELHLLIAQCLFEEQKYKEARPYFEFYYDHAEKIRKEDVYEMAYCDYKTGEWSKAIEKFKILNGAKDTLGQSSMYLLGDCYLKTGNKQSARNAFGICADMPFNEKQQESSMILYAMLSYETGYNDEALRQLNTLMATFPQTKYKDEANTLISGLLLRTNNFSEALKHLEAVSAKNDRYWQVYQKATFGYAVKEFEKDELINANKYFTLSLEHPVYADYEAAAWFWKGELAYRLHQYNDVITFSENFIKKGAHADAEKITSQATIQHGYLNMGYASMESQNYSEAQDFFAKAEEGRGRDTHSGAVASLREADAVFMQKNYGKAITLYDRIIANDPENADYARYQKSLLLGLQGKNADKIALLQTIVKKSPPSAYINYARYELAVTYLESDKYDDALTYLQQLMDQGADKSFLPKALMKIGFIEQQLNDNNKAIAAYKQVVTDYPASIERLPALDALKSLYIQNDDPAAYERMLKENGLPSADNGTVDSAYYAAAETQFSSGNWDNAAASFTSYLQQYPNGIFAIKAHYYRAESNYQLKKYDAALDDYNIVLTNPWNDFSENSARHAAAIAYGNKDYKGAYNYYLQLRNNAIGNQQREAAFTGLLKSGYNSGSFDDSRMFADSLLAVPGISAEITNDALFYKAKSLQQLDSNESAITIYRELSTDKNGETAAESRYHIAEILLQEGKLKEAETAANETIRQSSGNDYWIVKSYIQLSDVLVKENDYFNAKATLESVVKHTKIAELKQEASKKLEEVKLLEKHHSKLSEE